MRICYRRSLSRRGLEFSWKKESLEKRYKLGPGGTEKSLLWVLSCLEVVFAQTFHMPLQVLPYGPSRDGRGALSLPCWLYHGWHPSSRGTSSCLRWPVGAQRREGTQRRGGALRRGTH